MNNFHNTQRENEWSVTCDRTYTNEQIVMKTFMAKNNKINYAIEKLE